ncbi:unnamed protein product [Ectocarpus sp. 6 AP-2014]
MNVVSSGWGWVSSVLEGIRFTHLLIIYLVSTPCSSVVRVAQERLSLFFVCRCQLFAVRQCRFHLSTPFEFVCGQLPSLSMVRQRGVLSKTSVEQRRWPCILAPVKLLGTN